MQHEVENPRAMIAGILAQHYRELANLGEKPAPRFSVARVLAALADGGLVDGFERDICSAAAMAAGENFEKSAPLIPWGALAQRDITKAGTGQYLVGTDVGQAADVLRPWSVTANVGVQFFENLQGNLTIPRVGTAISGNWISDEAGTGAAESDPVLGQVALVPHVYVATAEYSRLFLKQSAQAEAFMRDQLLRAAGTALDRAVLAGAGGAEPLGLLSWPGVGTQSGTTLAWAGVTNMLETVCTANATDANVAFVSTPAVRELLQNREAVTTSGRFVWDADRVANRPAYATTNISAATMLCGDWSKVVVGLWGPGLRVDVNRAANFQAGIEAVRVLLQCDSGLLQAGAMCKSTSIT